nr:antitoxin MazE family protein [uncultured Halomonas sp.]
MMRSVNERVKKRREALRAQGLRPIQIWVPDTRSANFAMQCRAQSSALQGDAQEHDVLDWIEDVSDLGDWQ